MLSTLPTELLTQIISYLDDPHIKLNRHGRKELTSSRPSLWALSLVNHRLSAIVCLLLFEEVVLLLKGGAHLPLDVLRFAQACGDNPAVIRRVQRLHIHWRFSTPKFWAWDLWKAIGLAENLKALHLESAYSQSDENVLSIMIEYVVTRLRILEHLLINVARFKISPRLFWKICRARSLESLEISSQIFGVEYPFDMITPSGYLSDAQHSRSIPQTHLKSLGCSGSYLDLEALQLVLSNSPGLTKLKMSWPLSDTPQHLPSQNPYQLTQYNRSDSITRTLTACAENLRELVLVSGGQFIPNDYTVDLSWLCKLQQISLSVRLLGENSEGWHWTDTGIDGHLPSPDWFQKLPRGLHTLEIQFDSYGLFWTLAELRHRTGYEQSALPETSASWPRESDITLCPDFGRCLFEPRIGLEVVALHRLFWLKDTIMRKPGCLEHLIHLRVYETNSQKNKWKTSLRLDPDAWDRLDIVKVYPEAFKLSELNFQLLIRVPFNYVPPSLAFLKSQIPSAIPETIP